MYKFAVLAVCFSGGLIVASSLSFENQSSTTVAGLHADDLTVSSQATPVKQEKEQEKDKPKKRIVIPADDDKAVERRDFMRIKMQASQYILEGLTVKNFKLVNKGIQQIKDMTASEKWVTIDNEFYRELVQDFETATERLEAAAKTENIDATALRYYQLTTNCIDCHKHIRSAAYEF